MVKLSSIQCQARLSEFYWKMFNHPNSAPAAPGSGDRPILTHQPWGQHSSTPEVLGDPKNTPFPEFTNILADKNSNINPSERDENPV